LSEDKSGHDEFAHISNLDCPIILSFPARSGPNTRRP
jgi:hypothetical protein